MNLNIFIESVLLMFDFDTAEYVWIGGNGEFRSKIKVLPDFSKKYDKIPEPSKFSDWNFDGSSTEQAEGKFSEILIKPQSIFVSPFKVPNVNAAWLVLCDTYLPNGDPHPTNTRYYANKVFNEMLDQYPWYGLEQEYFLENPTTELPLGYDRRMSKYPNLNFQGPFYCGVGNDKAFGRNIIDEHLSACLEAGIKLSGVNAEVAPGQWEYQVGPCIGIESGDHTNMARYIMERIAEKHNVNINMHPKPFNGQWNGSGCHVNFSTKNMREGTEKHDGLWYIKNAIKELEIHHKEHMKIYGDNNRERMTGAHETAHYDNFNHGVGNRGASVRIPNETDANKKGYFEDRRPASNMDPYLVTGKIFETCVLNNKNI